MLINVYSKPHKGQYSITCKESWRSVKNPGINHGLSLVYLKLFVA